MKCKINLHPTICNLCGGKVVYIDNSQIYFGRRYGSGFCYYCVECGAYVGTHEPRPKEALGLLANEEMRDWKMKCHKLFDQYWLTQENKERRLLRTARQKAYKCLAADLGVPVDECHFGWFDLAMLKKTYDILCGWETKKALKMLGDDSYLW